MSTDSGKGARREILSLRFTPRQIEMIEQLAKEQNMTVSRLIRQAVSMYIFEQGGDLEESRQTYQRRKTNAA
jgi:hypothetical protein